MWARHHLGSKKGPGAEPPLQSPGFKGAIRSVVPSENQEDVPPDFSVDADFSDNLLPSSTPRTITVVASTPKDLSGQSRVHIAHAPTPPDKTENVHAESMQENNLPKGSVAVKSRGYYDFRGRLVEDGSDGPGTTLSYDGPLSVANKPNKVS
jgi:hypothetical protein